MCLGCILVQIGVLFASPRAYIPLISVLMRLNAIKVIWNEFSHYNMHKVGQNSLKKHAKSHSNSFKLQSIATSSVIWILTHSYSMDKYIKVSETIFGQFKVRKHSQN